MSNLEQTIRNAISGMFTANIAEEVVKRIVQAVEGDDCGDDKRMAQESEDNR